MTIESEAFAVVNQLPGLTAAERQYLMTVARGEGYYGHGWANASTVTLSNSASMGLTGYEGVGSNNWGAIQERKPTAENSFPHVDHDARGRPYIGRYKRYLTPLEGAADLAHVLLKPNLRAAINAGRDLGELAAIQRANGYYELAVEKYIAGVTRNYHKLTALLGWPALLKGAEVSNVGPLSLSGGFLGPASSSGELSEEDVEKLADAYNDEPPTTKRTI